MDENQEIPPLEAPDLLTRRTVIKFEQFERASYQFLGAETQTNKYAGCGCQITWLTPNQAVALAGLPLREISRNIDGNAVHFYETQSGLLFLCPNSLPRIGTRRSIE